ncbi:MAG TPA: hypothetical protein IGR64_02760 [Leptolyngbyaceae cyanobacterium M65_K2018_010]|nr:hypothetical protein [Leptolyngbyaceae cyanobacterium M65_K2018_010]
MDSIQEQVSLLTGKVDALHQMIDQIKGQISAMHASAQAPIDEEGELKLGAHGNGASHRNGPSLLDTVCEHKDILMDSSYGDLERQNTETHLSQDIQIQRLTAQLTAAYNRIAALEEQLLAIRVH